jgi:hypothetical protein
LGRWPATLYETPVTWADAFKLVATALVSVGGGGAIVMAMSGFLGRVWAGRLMERERADHARQLERLRSDLADQSAQRLRAIETELHVFRERLLRTESEKLTVYRQVADLITDSLAAFDQWRQGRLPPEQAVSLIGAFNRGRLRAYAYLGMVAPQSVMDAFDEWTDYILDALDGKPYEWTRIREFGLRLINCVREDVGFDRKPIEYRGHR